jgi:WD40 repeat protein
MSRRLLAVVSIPALVALASITRAQDEATGSPVSIADVSSAVAIFGKLGLPSVKDKRFVRLNTGQHWEREGKLEFSYTSGWLLSEEPNDAELLTTGLVRHHVKRDRSLPPDWEKYRADHPADLPLPGELATIDFEKAAEELAAGSAERYFGFGAMRHSSEGGLTRHAEACLFAYWERERGHEELAVKLETLAGHALQALRKDYRDKAPATLEVAVAEDVVENIRWKAINDANEGVPRPELLARWKLIGTLPHTSRTDEAKAMADAYASLIDEDSKWREPANLAEAPPADRVAYWMHGLRDLAARQWSQPGGVSVLGDFTGLPEHKVNPANELAKLGWDAIPTLIEGIGDSRPTRCMGYWRDFAPGSFYLLTIGDCCQEIFQAITGEDIYRRESTSGAMTKDGRAHAVQKAAREWWDKFKATDERSYLVSAVSSGEADGAARAERLVERFPDAAFAALKAGVAAAKTPRVRAYLVAVAGQLTKDDPTELPQTEAAADRPLPVRIAATRGLLRRGHRDALVPMIKAWEDGEGEAEGLLGLLVSSGEPSAIRALGKDLAKRPLAVRVAVLESLGSGGDRFEVGTGEDHVAPGEAREPASAARRKAWLEAIEDVLVSALDDETERTGVSGSWGGKSFSDPRICDTAGHLLWSRSPERYVFDLSGSLADRDRQRAAMKNAWRESRGLAPVATGWRPVAPADTTRVNAALDTFCGGDDAARAKGAAELEAIGLGGLAAIETRLAAVPAPQAEALERVAARVSSTVVDVVLSPGSIDPDAAWRARFDALRGRPLTAPMIVDLLVAAANGLPGEARGLCLTAERPSDGSGVVVSVAFEKEVGEPSGGALDKKGRRLPHADRTVRVTLGLEKIAPVSVGGSIKYASTPEAHAAARSAVERCVASPHRTPFMARATIAIFAGDPGAGSDEEAPAPVAEAKPAARADSFGDPLPESARARFGSLRFRHTGSIDCVAWTPDGKTVVSGGGDGAVRVWDAETGREIRHLIEFDKATWRVNDVESLSVSPDGKRVAAGNSDGKLRVWDLATGAKLLTAVHGDFVQSVAFSPDGKTVATACWDGSIRVFDATSGDLVHEVSLYKDKHSGSIYGRPQLAWTHDGTSIAVAGVDDKLRVWRVDGDGVRTFPAFKKTLCSIACSPDGSTIAAAGYDQKILLFDTKAEKPIRVLEVGEGEGRSGSFHFDFSPDGKTLASNDANTYSILLWDTASGAKRTLDGSRAGSALRFSPDGKRIASGGIDQIVRIWDLDKGRPTFAPRGVDGSVGTLALSPDDKMLAVEISDVTTLLDPETGEVRRRLAGHWARTLAFSPDATKLVSGSSGDLTLWETKSGTAVHSFPVDEYNWAWGIAFSPDGDTFVTADRDAKVRFYDAKEKKVRRTIDMKVLGAEHLAFSPDGKVLAGATEIAKVVLWDVATGEELRVLPGWPGRLVAFSPDGKLLVSAGRGNSVDSGGTTINLSDPATGELVRKVDTGEAIVALTVSADGRFIGVGGDKGSVTVWNAATLANVARFTGHGGRVGGVAFTKDARRLYSSSVDGTVLVWDVVEHRFR